MVTLRKESDGVKPGSTFHRFTVLGYQFRLHVKGYRRGRKATIKRWVCVAECSCGNIRIVNVLDLKRGFQQSCGCYRKEFAVKQGKANTRHGDSGSPLHNLWHLIKLRCNDPNQKSYPRYGGRGISMCAEWTNCYEVFRDYALAHGYKSGLQIDRFPDVDGNYEAGNVRFVTCKENSRNRRNTPFVTAFGETKTIVAWGEDPRCKVHFRLLWARLTGKRNKSKWKPELAITTPPLPRGRDRVIVPSDLIGTGNDIKTIYEVRGLTPKDK